MYSAVFEKNAKPVIDGLSLFLAGTDGTALEIGSGTGQHILAFAQAFPALQWLPSEHDAIHRHSIDAWRSFSNAATSKALAIDAAGDWSGPLANQLPLSLVLSLNVIHIAPVSVLDGILAGAGQCLKTGGYLVFYGPFTENGTHTGDGNALFDTRLRADNPAWGVRDVQAIIAQAGPLGLRHHDLIEMPSNNRLLVLRRG